MKSSTGIKYPAKTIIFWYWPITGRKATKLILWGLLVKGANNYVSVLTSRCKVWQLFSPWALFTGGKRPQKWWGHFYYFHLKFWKALTKPQLPIKKFLRDQLVKKKVLSFIESNTDAKVWSFDIDFNQRYIFQCSVKTLVKLALVALSQDISQPAVEIIIWRNKLKFIWKKYFFLIIWNKFCFSREPIWHREGYYCWTLFCM